MECDLDLRVFIDTSGGDMALNKLDTESYEKAPYMSQKDYNIEKYRKTDLFASEIKSEEAEDEEQKEEINKIELGTKSLITAKQKEARNKYQREKYQNEKANKSMKFEEQKEARKKYEREKYQREKENKSLKFEEQKEARKKYVREKYHREKANKSLKFEERKEARKKYEKEKYHREKGKKSLKFEERKEARNKYEREKYHREKANEHTHICEMCGKSFKIKFLLENHLRSHSRSEVKKVRGQRYTNDEMINAVKRAQEIGTIKAAAELELSSCTIYNWICLVFKPLFCNVCSKTFTCKDKLKIHEEKHRKNFKCETCFKTYVSSFALKRHLLQGCSEVSTIGEANNSESDFTRTVVQLAKETSISNCSSVHKLNYDKVWALVRQAEGKQYECQICHKPFPCQAKLQKHMICHNREPSLRELYFQRYSNEDKAGETFSSEVKMNEHLAEVKTKDKSDLPSVKDNFQGDMEPADAKKSNHVTCYITSEESKLEAGWVEVDIYLKSIKDSIQDGLRSRGDTIKTNFGNVSEHFVMKETPFEELSLLECDDITKEIIVEEDFTKLSYEVTSEHNSSPVFNEESVGSEDAMETNIKHEEDYSVDKRNTETPDVEQSLDQLNLSVGEACNNSIKDTKTEDTDNKSDEHQIDPEQSIEVNKTDVVHYEEDAKDMTNSITVAKSKDASLVKRGNRTATTSRPDKNWDTTREMEYIEEVEGLYQCTLCMQTRNTMVKATTHVRTSHPNINAKYECDICAKQFYYGFKYNMHMKRHTSPAERTVVATCEQCGQGFTRERNLKSHMLTVHTHTAKKEKEDSYRSFVCSFCAKSFFTQPHLTEHEHLHGDAKNFKCHNCPKSFKQSGGLRAHVRRKHRESGKPFMSEERKAIYKAYMVKYNAKYNAERRAKKAELKNIY